MYVPLWLFPFAFPFSQSSELALKAYNNRAACYKQLSNFDGTIEDSTQVLEYKPDDVKARMRRAQAYEACERYKSAIQDVRHVLAYGQEKVGKQSYDLANGMQHRLNRVIAQLKNWVEWLSVRLLLPHITTTPSRFTWKATHLLCERARTHIWHSQWWSNDAWQIIYSIFVFLYSLLSWFFLVVVLLNDTVWF